MILDTQEQFSAAQTVAAAVGDIVSTNVYDTGAAADSGAGEPVWLFAKLVAALTSGGAGTVQVVLQDSADNSSFADVLAGKAFTTTTGVANAELIKVRLPVGLRRYLRVVYRIAGATTTGGTASAYLTKDVQAQQYGASGFTVQ
ncbi:hypothetical protein EJP67_18595 [Variovorax guangxiensis]|uniref:Uncharacterized protein n=1 Tax=Variovorax guangxiensis TaxID=1775474 RepID=A0A3S0XB04_9BURK|nr:hypothetical protein [Variovorax guangxiensis]RUR69071.1 hypothetical protein EJP67_18595 [Variovorax guangxiensis]